MTELIQTITDFVANNTDLYLMLTIILGGRFIVSYTKDFTRVKDVYKVLFASLLFSTIFYLLDECRSACIHKYLFTYLFTTSFYETILKWIMDKVQEVFKGIAVKPLKK